MRVTINNFESLDLQRGKARGAQRRQRGRPAPVRPAFGLRLHCGQNRDGYAGEEKKEEELIQRLINRAVLKVFDKHVKIEELKDIIAYFDQGWGVEVSDTAPVEEYIEAVRTIPGTARGGGQNRTGRESGADGLDRGAGF